MRMEKNELEEFMFSPGPDVHTFIGKQIKIYKHRPELNRKGRF
jgi:hypothetical protein